MEFQILGPMEVLEDGRRVALGGSKQRALLGILLLHANDVVSRDRLIDELWGTSPPETATTVLQVYVSQLRKVLGRDTIVTRAPGYLIRVRDGELDLERFERLVEAARGEEAAVVAERLREALGLWRGPPLAELDSVAFARPERARLEEQRLAALERRIEADLELGRHAELAPELEGLVLEHPLRERLRGQLMLALYRCGRQAEALEIYRVGRRLLDEELGLQPGEELRRLERAVLEQDPSLAGLRAAGEHPALGVPTEEFPSPGTEKGARVTRVSGREEELPAPAEAASGAEERRLRLLGRSRLVAALGALVLAGAGAGVVVALTSGGGGPAVAVLPNSVAAIDPKTNQVVADVPVGGRPVAIAAGLGAVWVANSGDGTVLRIDPKTRRVTRTTGLGIQVADLAVGAGGVWVAGGNDSVVVHLSPDGEIHATIPLPTLELLGANPVFAVATSGSSVWAAAAGGVYPIDPETDRLGEPIRISEGDNPPLAAVATSDAVWAVLRPTTVVRVSPTLRSVIATLQLGEFLNGIAAGEGAIWVTDDTSVWRISSATDRATGSVRAGRGLWKVAVGEGAVWSANAEDGTVSRIDPSTEHVVARVRLGHSPVAVAVGYGAVWVGVAATAPFALNTAHAGLNESG